MLNAEMVQFFYDGKKWGLKVSPTLCKAFLSFRWWAEEAGGGEEEDGRKKDGEV